LTGRRASLCALLACVLFLSLGQPFVPRLGIEDDEALFAAPVLGPRFCTWAIRVGHSTIALMIMTYIGAVKTILLGPIVRHLGGTVWTVREPALLIGAASLWVFYRLLRRIASPRAALIGCVLLATDSQYLLTTVFDWGPVALQHLLLTAAMLCAVRFYQRRETISLAAACFLAGLALWDKALAVWMVTGLGFAAAVCFPRQIASVVTARRAAIAVLAFALGAAPLLTFNVTHGWATFRSNWKPDASGLATKGWLLLLTVRGEALFGYLAEESAPVPRQPSSVLERASAALASATGHPRGNLSAYALAAALLLLPLASAAARRTVLFALLAAAIAWALMSLNRNTGGGAHHAILLWPLPILTIAVSLDSVFAQRASRAAGATVLAALVCVLAASSLLVTNTYFACMVRHGGSTSWSGAVFPLSRTLLASHARAVYCVDWGILEGLRLLSRGKLPLRAQGFDDGAMREALSRPDHLFAGRTPQYEMFPGNTAKLTAFAARQGQAREPVAVVHDGYGRAIFEVFRFTQTSPSFRPSRTQ